ncbi:PREDICTED: uncharacterized protein LOC109183402 [Ipomoea nil]|uniref:uncharacterized protein LOC109183402 n=1 Tax=Ipomoea nil TaxID=35883 RepID=UPI000900B4A5|nr:PREDICTED: uncharacterized protein LOC109183402 [Ipomoea nil]
MFTNSSERTVTAGPDAPPANVQSPLSGAHHYVSIKLTYRNFLFWRTQLVPFLRGQELLGFIDGETPCPPPTIDATPASSDSNSAATTDAPTPNPAYKAWIKQDQSILSLLISSLSDEVMHLAVGKTTSKAVWESITAALGSSTRASVPKPPRPVPFSAEYRAMASSLTAAGIPVTIPQISDYLQAQEFIHAGDYPAGSDGGIVAAPAALYAGRGRRDTSDGGRNGQGRGRGGRGGQGRGRGGRKCVALSDM